MRISAVVVLCALALSACEAGYSDGLTRSRDDPDGLTQRIKPPSEPRYRQAFSDACRGAVVRYDFDAAFSDCLSLAKTGDLKAQSLLALLYFEGLGAPQDYAAAAEWYRKAANHGNAESKYSLGRMYELGLGVSQDYAEAARWYREAGGTPEAQTSLARLYAEGLGVQQNYAEAAKLYRKPATFGYAEAEFNLGMMYEAGLGVRQDHLEALKWYHWAAKHGYADALFYLASAHYHAHGVPRDLVKAYVFACEGIYAAQREAVSPRTRDLVKGIIVGYAIVQRGDVSPGAIAAAKARVLDEIAGDMTMTEFEEAQRLTWGACSEF